MTTNKPSPQDAFLEILRDERVPLSIYLCSGIRLVGQIEAFDAYIVLLKDASISQAIYKHSISTIVPSRPITLSSDRSSVSEVIIKRRTPYRLARNRHTEPESVE